MLDVTIELSIPETEIRPFVMQVLASSEESMSKDFYGKAIVLGGSARSCDVEAMVAFTAGLTEALDLRPS